MRQRQAPSYAVTVEEVREFLRTPAEYGPEQIERLSRIYDSFDGPEDLSSNLRDYIADKRD